MKTLTRRYPPLIAFIVRGTLGRVLFMLALVSPLVLVSPFSGLFSQENKAPFFEWQPVLGAGGYMVQTRDASGKVVFERTVRQNRVEMPLPPGKYQTRLAVLNKFQKPQGWSDWNDFNVKVPESAGVEDISTIDTGKKGETTVLIEGKNFTDATKVFVDTDKGKVEAKKVEVKSEGKLIASFEADKLNKGEHDIVLENPHNRVTRVEDAVKLGDDKKVVATGNTRNTFEGKDAGKDPTDVKKQDDAKKDNRDKTDGKRTDGKIDLADQEIYPAYNGSGEWSCGSAGYCQRSGIKYKWNFSLGTFVPGYTRIKAGEKKGYVMAGLIGGLGAGAIVMDRRADKVAKSTSDGLQGIFNGPQVIATAGYWTQPAFLVLANEQYKTLRAKRAAYKSDIHARDSLIGGMALLYLISVLDSATAGQGLFIEPERPVTGPIPMTRTLSNSTVKFKMTSDVWIPGRARSKANKPGGTPILGFFGVLGAGIAYEAYETNRARHDAAELKNRPFNQLVSGPISALTLPYWTNPGFVYAVAESSREFKSARNRYHESQKIGGILMGVALTAYLAQIADAATLNSTPGFFDAVEMPNGTNPLPMADMYCGSGPCAYAPAVEPNFKFRAAALVPGSARIKSGDKKTGYGFAGGVIGLGAAAVYEGYEMNRIRRAAVRKNHEGINALFTSQLAVLSSVNAWTQPAYVVLFSEYYGSVRKFSNSYSTARSARDISLASAASLYLIQFLDGCTMPTSGRTSDFSRGPQVSLNAIQEDVAAEKARFLASDKLELHEKASLTNLGRVQYNTQF